MKAIPIRKQLTAWYFLIVAAALVGFAIFALALMRQSIYSTVDEQLEDKSRALQSLIANSDAASVADELKKRAELQSGSQLFQVSDNSGHFIYRSRVMQQIGVPASRPRQSRTENAEYDGLPLRMMTTTAVAGKLTLVVQVAEPMDDFLEAVERFRTAMLLGIPVLLLAAAGGGYWMSTRAMRPVREITGAAQSITPQDLSQRVAVPQTGDELQQLAETLNNMLNRIEAAVVRISQFTADASHELRTPIALIRTRAEVTLDNPRTNDEYRNALQEVLAESERTSALIENLMLLARSDTGTEALHFQRTDLNAVARDVCTQAQTLAEAKHLTWKAVIPEAPIRVHGDVQSLRRLLLILIDNAVKYTPHGGSVSLTIRSAGNHAEIVVQDTGIGIPEADLPHIFERFYRADKARSRGQGGTGLGLSIGRWITHAHGVAPKHSVVPGVRLLRIRLGRVIAFAASLVFSAVSRAEEPSKFIAQNGCPAGVNFEQHHYMVRSARVDDPFNFLAWVGQKKTSAAKAISALVDNQPFAYHTAVAAALDIIEQERFLPETNDRVKIAVEFVTAENCVDNKLDLVYRVYSSQILPVLSGTSEQRSVEKKTPQSTVGLESAGSSYLLVPGLGYDASDRLFAGGRFQWKNNAGTGPLSLVEVEGYGSSTMRNVNASLGGNRGSEGWLANASWSLNYVSMLAPLIVGQQSQNFGTAQFSPVSKSFSQGNIIARFGGDLEGGNLHSTFLGEQLSNNTLPNAGYGAAKIYLGLSSRLPRTVVSVSYGVELGSVGPSASVGWIKQVGDFSLDFWHPLGEHRTLDLQSRVNAGGIVIPGSIPASARFFGGSREQFFTTGNDWQIRSAPVIRAIPGILLYRTAQGAGADTFFSYNLTAAYTLRYKPLMPPELAKDTEFQSLMEAQIVSASSTEQNYYATKDPHYQALVAFLPALQDALAGAKQVVANAQASRPGQFQTEFKSCTSAINMAALRAKNAAAQKSVKQYGNILALLSADNTEDRLNKVRDACGVQLNGAINDLGVGDSAATVDKIRKQMEEAYGEIDQEEARKKAAADMVFIRRTLQTLFNDLNIYSISPVAVLDVAYIGPRANKLGGIRFGPGAGIRFELASSINFTVGYAWNVNSRPGEGHGAVFFGLAVRDLFSF